MPRAPSLLLLLFVALALGGPNGVLAHGGGKKGRNSAWSSLLKQRLTLSGLDASTPPDDALDLGARFAARAVASIDGKGGAYPVYFDCVNVDPDAAEGVAFLCETQTILTGLGTIVGEGTLYYKDGVLAGTAAVTGGTGAFSVSGGGSSGGDVPHEDISLNFGKIDDDTFDFIRYSAEK